MSTNDGGPAFPIAPWRDYYESTAEDGSPYHDQHDGSPGMSLRDWFAGMAIQGLLHDPDWRNPAMLGPAEKEFNELTQAAQVELFEIAVAMKAYDLADAMIAQREKP